jgi:hypothetical protein
MDRVPKHKDVPFDLFQFSALAPGRESAHNNIIFNILQDITPPPGGAGQSESSPQPYPNQATG